MELWVLFALLHVPLALLMQQVPLISSGIALLAGLFGILAVFNPQKPDRAILAAAYISGSGVLWRMTGVSSGLAYEKYLVAAIFLLATLTRRPGKRVGSEIFYLLLLLPSAALTVFNSSPAVAQYELGINLSGPLALWAGLWFFTGQKLNRGDAQQITMAFLAPVTGILTLVITGVLQAGSLVFSRFDSSFQASGGFHPNYISLIFGIGALLCFSYLVALRPRGVVRIFLIGMLVSLLTQTALTFSRGGIYIFAVAALITVVFALKDRLTRKTATIVLAGLVFAGLFIILPILSQLTNNVILDRFLDLDTSGRAQLAQTEIALWLAHPLMGVGPGMGNAERARAVKATSAMHSHNEFSRLPAEHGLPGLAALMILISICWRNIRSRGPHGAQVWAVSLCAVALAGLTYLGFRFVALAFFLSASTADFDFSESDYENTTHQVTQTATGRSPGLQAPSKT